MYSTRPWVNLEGLHSLWTAGCNCWGHLPRQQRRIDPASQPEALCLQTLPGIFCCQAAESNSLKTRKRETWIGRWEHKEPASVVTFWISIVFYIEWIGVFLQIPGRWKISLGVNHDCKPRNSCLQVFWNKMLSFVINEVLFYQFYILTWIKKFPQPLICFQCLQTIWKKLITCKCN